MASSIRELHVHEASQVSQVVAKVHHTDGFCSSAEDFGVSAIG
jgi:hypothetical protein